MKDKATSADTKRENLQMRNLGYNAGLAGRPALDSYSSHPVYMAGWRRGGERRQLLLNGEMEKEEE